MTSPLTTLIIARHGNTFREGETPTRVGARTDLPLVEKGEEQARRLGEALRAKSLLPDHIFTSTLQRTIKTAELAAQEMNCLAPREPLTIFNEIDYGPDENKPEPEVVARLGAEALKSWDADCLMPAGWSPRPEEILKNWKNFLTRLETHFSGKTVLVVTSNGIARFALNLALPSDHPRKLATGAYGVLCFCASAWQVQEWNTRPEREVKEERG